jgi:hypothetical protein
MTTNHIRNLSEGREDLKSELVSTLTSIAMEELNELKKELLVLQTRLWYLERRMADTFGSDQEEERDIR